MTFLGINYNISMYTFDEGCAETYNILDNVAYTHTQAYTSDNSMHHFLTVAKLRSTYI